METKGRASSLGMTDWSWRVNSTKQAVARCAWEVYVAAEARPTRRSFPYAGLDLCPPTKESGRTNRAQGAGLLRGKHQLIKIDFWAASVMMNLRLLLSVVLCGPSVRYLI
jgi:hypothetical protein